VVAGAQPIGFRIQKGQDALALIIMDEVPCSPRSAAEQRIETKMSRICNPASNMTIRPEAAISNAVPKSGCVTIMAVGIAIKTP